MARPRRAAPRLVPVNVSRERVIRTTVGLRPHRDAGFVVRADRLDEKLLVHNYGHGGAGYSLSWGTGLLATELALGHTERRAAVIGSGIVGLTTARQLQRHGFDVTIYALPSTGTEPKVRLGMITAASTMKFTVPRHGVQASGSLVLMLHAIGAKSTWVSPSVVVPDGGAAYLEISSNPYGDLSSSVFYALASTSN